MSAESKVVPLPAPGVPPAEVAVDQPLVLGLLQAQHSDLAALSLRPVDAGWDNFMFRLGDRLAVRLPRRALAATLVENEQTWLPELAPSLPLPVPAPVRRGVPGCGYPWRWSVVPWIGGGPADLNEPDGGQARPYARFLQALHVTAPDAAPLNAYRGVPLAERAEAIEQRMERLDRAGHPIPEKVRRLWRDALAAPVDVPPTWIHGDLHASNVLVEQGRITGVIDWGDITAGDRATDLASIWMLFEDATARAAAIEACGGVSETTWARARGWAILFGVLLWETGLVNHARHAVMGLRTLERVAAGP